MATYNCIPSTQTVPPCPSGTAPNAVFVNSTSQPEYYTGYFDHIPLQDVIVGVAMVLSLLLGVMSGRR